MSQKVFFFSLFIFYFSSPDYLPGTRRPNSTGSNCWKNSPSSKNCGSGKNSRDSKNYDSWECHSRPKNRHAGSCSRSTEHSSRGGNFWFFDF